MFSGFGYDWGGDGFVDRSMWSDKLKAAVKRNTLGKELIDTFLKEGEALPNRTSPLRVNCSSTLALDNCLLAVLSNLPL
jgi:predicted DNA-binding ribbon-helix-helix protein